jgi:hypothetical protein
VGVGYTAWGYTRARRPHHSTKQHTHSDTLTHTHFFFTPRNVEQGMNLLKDLNSLRLPLLPEVLLDLMLMSSSRSEAERLCALQVLSSACCTEVPVNRNVLLDNHLFRQVGAPGGLGRAHLSPHRPTHTPLSLSIYNRDQLLVCGCAACAAVPVQASFLAGVHLRHQLLPPLYSPPIRVPSSTPMSLSRPSRIIQRFCTCIRCPNGSAPRRLPSATLLWRSYCQWSPVTPLQWAGWSIPQARCELSLARSGSQ